jgi:hypothetical protein
LKILLFVDRAPDGVTDASHVGLVWLNSLLEGQTFQIGSGNYVMLLAMLTKASPTTYHAPIDRANKVRYITHDGRESTQSRIHSRNFIDTPFVELAVNLNKGTTGHLSLLGFGGGILP